jgi:hypothetical protein
MAIWSWIRLGGANRVVRAIGAKEEAAKDG